MTAEAATRILVASSPGERRIAVVSDGVLQDYALWRPGQPDGIGDVYRARVAAHVPHMAGAFLNLPDGDGFLPDGDGFLPDSEGAAGAVEGALLAVRVVRAGQGGKGKRLARADAPPGEPGLVARGPSPLDDLRAAYPAAEWVTDDAGLLLPGARLVASAFDAGVAEQVAALAEPEVALPGGMRASIHPTPALVAIDLDTAGATAGRGGKASAQMAANLRALPALARQIRLRNLSGAILIDPAGLAPARRAKLGPALSAALADDPLQPRLLGFTALGLAEIVRRRRRPPLHELLAGPAAAALAAMRTLATESAATPHAAFRIVAAPDVHAALAADALATADLARRTGRTLISASDPALPPGTAHLERLR